MTTNTSRSISAVARMFRAIPAETLKSAIDDVEDQFSANGESAITSKEANTGPSEGMHGGNATTMIRSHSDLDAQRGRMAEYDSLAGLMSDIAKAMKAQTEALAALAPKAKTAKAVEGELSYLAVAEKNLKKAKIEIFKAETEVEAEEDSSDDRVAKAERLVTKAAELLAKAEDDEDEDEDRVEKARDTVRKLTKALKPFKDAAVAKAAAKDAADAVTKAATEATAAAALVAAKAEDKGEKKEETDEKKEETAKSALETSVAALQDQFGMVTKSVTEVMEMVSGLSRGAKQPNFVAAKAVIEAKTDEPVDFTARAEEAADNGRISTSELIKCNNVISRLTIAKSGSGGVMNDLAAVKADLATASSGVREVFASLLTA